MSKFFIILLAKSAAFLMQGNTVALLTDALTLSADALALLVDALALSADALALLTDALTLQGIVKLNSLQTNQMLY